MNEAMSKLIESFMAKNEDEAWNQVKGQMTSEKLPGQFNKLIEEAFRVGHSSGGITAEKEFKLFFKLDPVGFFEWLKGE